jgi:hypothetical protein
MFVEMDVKLIRMHTETLSRHIYSWVRLPVNQSSLPLLDMSVVHDIDNFLHSGKYEPDDHQNNHVQQSIVVTRCITTLEQLCPDHHTAVRTHDPHGNRYTALARRLAVQLKS